MKGHGTRGAAATGQVATACTPPGPALCAQPGPHANRRPHFSRRGADPTLSQEGQQAIRVRWIAEAPALAPGATVCSDGVRPPARTPPRRGARTWGAAPATGGAGQWRSTPRPLAEYSASRLTYFAGGARHAVRLMAGRTK